MPHFKKRHLALIISATLVTACDDDATTGEIATENQQSNTIIKTESLSAESSECLYGGVKYIAGYDENSNGTLEESEYVAERSVCNDGTQVSNNDDNDIFQQALVNVALIAKNDNTCPDGGQLVTVGLDLNENGLLDKEEVVDFEALCIDGADFAPEPIINAINANPSIVITGGSTTINASISNLSDTDTIIWTNENGDVIEPADVNVPNEIEVTVGNTVGSEVYMIYLETQNEEGETVVQTKQVTITVAQAPAATQSVVLNSQQVFLPSGYSTAQLTGHVYGTVIYATPIVANPAVQAMPTPDNTKLVGFVAERNVSSLSLGTTTSQILDNSLQSFVNNSAATLTQLSKVVLANGDVSASYRVVFNSGAKLTDVLNKLVSTTAVNAVNGTATSLLPSLTESEETDFRLDITISYDETADRAVTTATLVSDNDVEVYEDLILSTTSEIIKADVNATLQVMNDSYTATNQATSKADFLFVIDNSGSMSDEQNAISLLTQEFTDTISNAAVDYRVGTITTDNATLRGTGFTDVIEQIEADFLPGTSGSGYERGIYFSEMALSPGNSVETAGFPRAGASLSVVIMSDEPSQYPSGTFDPLDNLFIDNGYRVYSIVNPAHASTSQYDDLAVATLGQTLNIGVLDEYGTFVDTLAKSAGALTAGYKLTLAETHEVLSSSISVEVDGQAVDRSSENGWQYYPLSSTIVFTGSAIPAEGGSISITYQYVKSGN